MSQIHNQKMTVELDDEVIVFLIGMRINKPWKIHKWWPVFIAMPRMLRELRNNPDLGLIQARLLGTTVIQYWRSFAHLEAYARGKDHLHLPAWQQFNKKIRHSEGDVGIWHETYRVKVGQFEAIYNAMPPIGLGLAGRLVPVGKYTETAHQRLNGTAAHPEKELA